MKMIESGLVDHWMKKYWPSINRCSADSLSKAGEPMNLADTQSAFFLVFVGLGLAILSLFSEILMQMWTNRLKSRQFDLKSDDVQSRNERKGPIAMDVKTVQNGAVSRVGRSNSRKV